MPCLGIGRVHTTSDASTRVAGPSRRLRSWRSTRARRVSDHSTISLHLSPPRRCLVAPRRTHTDSHSETPAASPRRCARPSRAPSRSSWRRVARGGDQKLPASSRWWRSNSRSTHRRRRWCGGPLISRRHRTSAPRSWMRTFLRPRRSRARISRRSSWRRSGASSRREPSERVAPARDGRGRTIAHGRRPFEPASPAVAWRLERRDGGWRAAAHPDCTPPDMAVLGACPCHRGRPSERSARALP